LNKECQDGNVAALQVEPQVDQSLVPSRAAQSKIFIITNIHAATIDLSSSCQSVSLQAGAAG
jgi:hypothetical protein